MIVVSASSITTTTTFTAAATATLLIFVFLVLCRYDHEEDGEYEEMVAKEEEVIEKFRNIMKQEHGMDV